MLFWLKMVKIDKRSSLVVRSVSDEEKKFYVVDTSSANDTA
jgi:hypothetical protein